MKTHQWKALRVLGLGLAFSADIHLLPKIIDAASRYTTRPNDGDMTAMMKKQRVTTLFGLGPNTIC